MDLVRQLRRKKGWSQPQLAEAARVSRATVQRIEAGRLVPSPETALALASALDADASAIRVGAGLANAIARVAAIVNERDATDSELATLPREYRIIFKNYQSAQAALPAAVSAYERVLQRSTELSTEQWSAADRRLRAVVALAVDPRDEAARVDLRESIERVEELGSEQEALVARLRECSASVLAAFRTFNEAGSQFTKVLLRFV